MEKLDINLDGDFKNINTDLGNNIGDTIGIDLLVNNRNINENVGNSSPKSHISEENKSVNSNNSDDFSFFKGDTNDTNVQLQITNVQITNDKIIGPINSENSFDSLTLQFFLGCRHTLQS